MKLLMLRVFMDTANGGYYSPLHEDGCASILPMPETEKLRYVPSFLNPDNVIDPCGYGCLSRYYVKECFKNIQKAIHNDPRPDLGFYTGHYSPKGRIPKSPHKKLDEGDIILFMAGLAEYPDNLWEKKPSLRDIQKSLSKLKKRGKAGIYVVSGLIVERIVDVKLSSWSKVLKKYPVLRFSPHYYRLKDHTIAVLGRGFNINPPLKIYCFKQGITRTFIELIGRENAIKIMKNNFRKSGIIEIPYRRIRDIVYLV